MNNVKVFWDINWQTHSSSLSENEQQKIDYINEIIPSDVRTVLDVGCGNGKVTNRLSDNLDVVGIDQSLSGLLNIQSAKRVAGGIGNLPFHDNAFDLVLCSEVLEHVGNEDFFQSVLAELSRISNKYILITNPANDDPHSYLVRCNHCGTLFHPSQHVRFFRRKDYIDLISGWRLFSLKETGKRFMNVKFLIMAALCFSKWTGDAFEGMICLVCNNKIEVRHYKNSFPSLLFKAVNAFIRRGKEKLNIYKTHNFVALYKNDEE